MVSAMTDARGLLKRLIEIAIAAAFLGGAAYALAMRAGDERIESLSQSVADDLALLRREALSRGARVGACASADGQACHEDQRDWSKGWIVFLDADADGVRDTAASADEWVLHARGALPKGLSLERTGAAMPAYLANGRPAGAAGELFRLCGGRRDGGRAIPLAPMGRSKPAPTACA